MNRELATDDAIAALRRLVDFVQLSHALRRAQAGEYAEAETALAGLDPGDVTVLDLKARIRAQQGRPSEADSIWRAVLERDPAHAGALAGLDRLHGSPPWWVAPSRALLLLLAGGAVAGAAVLLGMRHVSWEAGLLVLGIGLSPLMLAAATRRLEAPRIGRWDGIRDDLTREVDRLRRTLPNLPPDVTIAVPGVRSHAEGDELVITFESGLFAEGGERLRSGRDRLREVARQIEPHAPFVRVGLVGHSAGAPAITGSARGRMALGMARAWAVFREMRSAADLPADRFEFRTAGLRDAPFPPPDPRNETVVIRIRRVGPPGAGPRK